MPDADLTRLFDLPIVDRMHALCVPAASVAIFEAGEVTEHRAFGVRTAGEASPVTPETRFQACSISKPVAALAMLRLAEWGHLDLDADVNDTLVGWRVPQNGAWQPRVTLRHLVSHSAGLTTHGFPGYSRRDTVPTLVQVLSGVSPANTEGVRVDIVPGVQFRYSGGGTTVMQLLLEQVTSTPVSDLLLELVLDPLGMRHSGYEQPLPEDLHEVAATAHHRDGRPVTGGWHVYPEQCAAGLWTTPTDLARFALGIQRAIAGEPGALISAGLANKMLTPQSPPLSTAERIGGLNAVGLGLFVRHVEGYTSYFGHSGGNEGFRCHLLAHRDRGFGACVMTNSDSGGPLLVDVFDAVAANRGWDDYQSEPPDELPPSGEGLDPFTGSFLSDSGLTVEVTRDGDDLHVIVDGQPSLIFLASDATTIASEAVDATVTVADDGLALHQSGTETHLTRTMGG